MKYTIMEYKNGISYPIIDKNGNYYRFDNDEEAYIERIYLQPDYDNLLKIMMIVGEK